MAAEPRDIFDLNRIPFYNAVRLFEMSAYQQAFDIFIQCAKSSNLYAAYYLDDILQNHRAKITIKEADSGFIKELPEYLDTIPASTKPKSWLLASLYKMEYAKTIDKKKKKHILNNMKALLPFAANATTFIFEQREYLTNLEEKKRIEVFLYQECSLYTLCHWQQFYRQKLLKPNQALKSLLKERLEAMVNYKKLSHLIDSPDREFEWQLAETFNPDSPTGIGWKIHAAMMGNKNALTLLVEYAGAGIQVLPSGPFSKKEKAQFQVLAAKQGDIISQMNVGRYYRDWDDPHIPKDLAKARFYLEAVVANKEFIELMSNGTLTPEKLIAYADIFFVLGLMHEYGEGGFEVSTGRAFEYYRKAAVFEHPRACVLVAEAYAYGTHDCIRDDNEAIRWVNLSLKTLTKANAKDHWTRTQLMLGIISKRLSTEDGYKKAVEHFRAILDDCRGLGSYAEMVYHGKGVAENKQEGLRQLVQAAKQGAMRFQQMMIDFYFNKTHTLTEMSLTKEEVERFLMLRPKKERAYYTLLGEFYISHSEPPDYKKAKEFLEIALKNNSDDATALFFMGIIYERGEPKNLSKAFEYYCHGAELGNLLCKYNEACFLLKGISVPKDEMRARVMFEECFNKGHHLSAHNLFYIYRYGFGVAVDKKLAYEWLERALPSQDAVVFHDMGCCYGLGEISGEKEYSKAIAFWDSALRLGYLKAMVNYIVVRLQQALEGQFVPKLLIVELNTKLQPFVLKEYSVAIFLDAMLRLLLDPSQKDNVIKMLADSIANKPFERSRVVMEYLAGCSHVDSAEIIDFIFDPQPAKKIEEMRQSHLKQKSAKKSASSAVKEIAPLPMLPEPAKPERTSTTSDLKTDVESFLAQGARRVDLRAFTSLVDTLLKQEDVEGEATFSRGSIKIKVQPDEPGARALTFSSHPMHRSGASAALAGDPRRGRDAQDFIRDLSARAGSASAKKAAAPT